MIVVGADRPEYAMPAAGFAAKSGDPILFVTRDSVPKATRVALTANDGRNTAGATFYLTNVSGDFNPSSGAPSRLRVRFTIAGLGAVLGFLHRDPHGTVFAHYIRPNGKLKGTRQFGHLTGPCGDLRTSRTRLLPFASELGAWKIYLDTNRSYKRHELAQLLVGFKVRRISISR